MLNQVYPGPEWDGGIFGARLCRFGFGVAATVHQNKASFFLDVMCVVFFSMQFKVFYAFFNLTCFLVYFYHIRTHTHTHTHPHTHTHTKKETYTYKKKRAKNKLECPEQP